KKENAQVVLTSHSSAIIKRISPNEIRYLRLDVESQSTKVKSISLPEEEIYADEYKFVKEAVTAYPELYFSKLVILGEGDSEELILSKFFEINGGNVDISEISVVPLGGRFVNHFWRLLADLEIPYITLLDLDRERSGGGWGRIKYALTQLIARGYNRDEILQLADGNVMSEETFLRMHNWDVANIKCMESWITRLENYGIFFSSPLDIDFLMLEIFEDSYKYILSENEGPRLKIDGESKPIKELGDELFESKEYNSRIKDSVHATLKKEGGKGDTYTDIQQKLMIWYNYFFLGRGKPTTHISMFANIDEEKLKKSTPEVIKKIITKANHILTGDVQDE
ncbi:ATP-dependent nuclease, partial [Lactococcus lactis]